MIISDSHPTLECGSLATAGAPICNPSDIASFLKAYLRNMAYNPPDIQSTNESLEAAMQAEMVARNIRCAQLEKTLHLAASFVELVFHNLDFAEKKRIALTNWYVHRFHSRQTSSKNPAPFSVFELRFLRGQPQLDPVLDAIAEKLHEMWEKYDPLCANSIITSIFEFISSECITPDVETLRLVRSPANRFPWYQRERTGVSAAFAFMTFPKSLKLNIKEFIQAIPEIGFFVSVMNDILSFYKEELAGEKENNIRVRAYVDDKTPLQVLSDMSDELRASTNVLRVALAESPSALQAWETFERGYIAWHLELDRYRLKDLGL